jgi:hypothetical protein
MGSDAWYIARGARKVPALGKNTGATIWAM